MRAFSPEELDAISDSIATDGYAVIANYLDAETVRRSQQVVKDSVAKNRGKYTLFSGQKGVQDVFSIDFENDQLFRSLCRDIYERQMKSTPPDEPIVQIIRCFTGSDSDGHALTFHFDSYVLTLIIPVLMPVGSPSGNLLILPNLRGFRKQYVRNVVDKLVYCGPVGQAVFRFLYRIKSPIIRHVCLNPGDLYVFCGYKTLHTNESCDASQIRATAIFHFANPHKKSWKDVSHAYAEH